MPHSFFAARSWILTLGMLVAVSSADAQQNARFTARLSPLGVTGATVNMVTGSGSVTATLSGATLRLEGTFAGLAGPATQANVRVGPKAIPGPVVFELDVPKATSGKIAAALTLTPEQVADLEAGRLYVQIHSERAPEGSIRGWLLK